ncbi:MAG: hypothetical protein J3R72DRAFT_441369 [Linnemannia gamsii]|nr:MAG: hypothetical protein J3R72DRAFT_441369 [Linnemannia gamsii]
MYCTLLLSVSHSLPSSLLLSLLVSNRKGLERIVVVVGAYVRMCVIDASSLFLPYYCSDQADDVAGRGHLLFPFKRVIIMHFFSSFSPFVSLLSNFSSSLSSLFIPTIS